MGQASQRGTKAERIAMATIRNKEELQRKLEEIKAMNARIEAFPKDMKLVPMVGIALAQLQYQQ